MIIPLLHKVLLRQDVSESKKKLDEDLKKVAKAVPGFVIAGDESISEAKRDQAGIDYGTVVSIGPTAYRDYHTDIPIAIGDRVVIAKYAGKVVKDGEEELLLVNDEDILAITKESSNG